jgi:hypothetical protein
MFLAPQIKSNLVSVSTVFLLSSVGQQKKPLRVPWRRIGNPISLAYNFRISRLEYFVKNNQRTAPNQVRLATNSAFSISLYHKTHTFPSLRERASRTGRKSGEHFRPFIFSISQKTLFYVHTRKKISPAPFSVFLFLLHHMTATVVFRVFPLCHQLYSLQRHDIAGNFFATDNLPQAVSPALHCRRLLRVGQVAVVNASNATLGVVEQLAYD